MKQVPFSINGTAKQGRRWQPAGANRPRSRPRRPGISLALPLLWCICTNVFAQPGGFGPPKVKPALYSSVKAVAPGQSFDVAIQFDIQPGWHIYWSNPGASGFPPSATWKLPEGFEASPFRFPVPRKHTTAGLTTYILEGKPILLTTITPPQTLKPGKVTLQADLRWLVCQESCIPEDKSIKLELPVAKSGDSPAADHVDLYKQAAAAMPASRSEYVQLKVSAPGFSTEPGRKFDLILDVEVKPGHHIQSNRPAQDFLIATDVLMENTGGIAFGEPQYPQAHERDVPELGKVSEFSGKVSIKIPCQVRDEPPKGPVSLGGLLTFQACTDQGQCFRPETLAFSVSPEAGAAPPPAGKPDTATPQAPSQTPERGQPEESASGAGTTSTPDRAAPPAGQEEITLFAAMAFGFLGGLIMNIMPCVLPVISIKILSFVKQAGEDRGRVFRLGLAFSAGIFVWFWAFAAIRLLGHIPLQHPAVVIGLTAVMFVFGLSLFGVFEINLPGQTASALDATAAREGYLGAFLKGLLATLLGTACTAPFFTTALGWALTQPKTTVYLVFTAMALGMSLPYLVLSAVPAWLKYVPKPGNWMITFKQCMGFVLVGTAVWLLLTVAALMGASGVVATVAFLSFLGFSCWLIGRINFNSSALRHGVCWLTAVLVALGGGWFSFTSIYEGRQAHAAPPGTLLAGDIDPWKLDWQFGIPWQRYAPGLAEKLARGGATVYVDYTAEWCLNCQTNKKVVLETQEVMAAMKELGVVPIEADYTAYDPAIDADLRFFKSGGVPLNVIYPAGRPDEVIVLPSILTKQTVIDALRKAGPSQASRPTQSDAGRPGTEDERR